MHQSNNLAPAGTKTPTGGHFKCYFAGVCQSLDKTQAEVGIEHGDAGRADHAVGPRQILRTGQDHEVGVATGNVQRISEVGPGLNHVRDVTRTGITYSRTGLEMNYQDEIRDSATPDLVQTVTRALTAFRDRAAWLAVMRRGMSRDFSWDASARRYADLYAGLAGARS